MISAMSGGDGLSSAASAYFAQQLPAVNGSTSGLTGAEGGGGIAPISTTISGPGQLLGNLQQLQAQDPTKFQQVVSQIATQLQSAAQQAQGPQSNLLSNLATKFQNVASGGSLSQLQPQQHHHHHHAQQAYSQNSQNQPQGVAALVQPSGSQSSSSSTLQQLFTNISTKVRQALAS
jgi:hypothetical protein